MPESSANRGDGGLIDGPYTASNPGVRAQEDWDALRTFSLYRSAVAAGLFALFAGGLAGAVFDLRWPGLFGLICIAYALHIAPCWLALSRRIVQPTWLVQGYVLADIALVASLFLATVGVKEGLGVLLIAPIAVAGLLLSQRMAVLYASIASTAVISAELMRAVFQADPQPEYIQSGLLGTLFFVIALSAHTLAQRARANAQLAEERKGELDDLAALNERIIQEVQVGLMVLDEDARIRMLNRAASKMLGVGPDLVGSRLTSASTPLAWALEAWQLSPTLPPEPMGTGPRILLPKFHRLGAGNRSPILVLLEDARRAGEQAQHMKLASLGRLTASIAHEIRNPLSAISHASQLLGESEVLDDGDRRLLDIVYRHADRIEGIIKAILGLSRRGDTTPQNIKLREWLNPAVVEYLQGKREPMDIDTDAIPERVSLRVDPEHLRQILYNLWDNADRHARVESRGLEIRMSLEAEDGVDYLVITDNGPGIRGAAADNIMEPFFTTRNDGTGLGLYIVQGLCECNGMAIALTPAEEAAPGAGASFRISLDAANVEYLPASLPGSSQRAALP